MPETSPPGLEIHILEALYAATAELPSQGNEFPSTNPFRYAGLSGVNLLPSADKAYEGTPVWMPIHYANEELWLRHVEVCLPPFALHKARCLRAGPGSLRLVEHDDLLNRNISVSDVMVPEMMNILDEVADSALGSLF
jgi:hypothetical protein